MSSVFDCRGAICPLKFSKIFLIFLTVWDPGAVHPTRESILKILRPPVVRPAANCETGCSGDRSRTCEYLTQAAHVRYHHHDASKSILRVSSRCWSETGALGKVVHPLHSAQLSRPSCEHCTPNSLAGSRKFLPGYLLIDATIASQPRKNRQGSPFLALFARSGHPSTIISTCPHRNL
jgi:hypothetical protein